ncbi:hypothetical protein [Marivita geojedonensis]|uniref:Uncharacterized protein n=1 Tax=Marivita geojedonensis TaxID=1123756 RepID=A0A1X4NDI9_9RHOB|nr:hypothetical protein [Marivita geojedonensis]OSQ44933.1 hypothetical protein MGEO_18485 [Marivita geojedonensis]PRY73855.1 hypothetical protein CLV76_12734 [Marivita geojedonensis]
MRGNGLPKSLPVSAIIAAFNLRNSEVSESLNAALARAQIDEWGGTHRPLDWARNFFETAYQPNPVTGAASFVGIPKSIQSLLLHFAAETELAVNGQISEGIGSEIAHWAATDFDTFTMAQMMVIEAATGKPRLPASLHNLTKKIASGTTAPQKRGDRSWKLSNRNRIGIAALNVLTNEAGFDLTPTRSVASSGVSACDILAEAASGFGWASITAAGADEIWRNRERWTLEWHLCLALGAFMTGEEKGLPTEFTLRALRWLKAVPSGRKGKNQPDEPTA